MRRTATGAGLIVTAAVGAGICGCESGYPSWEPTGEPVKPVAEAPESPGVTTALAAAPEPAEEPAPTEVIHPMLGGSRPGVAPPQARGRRNAYRQVNLIASSAEFDPIISADHHLVDAWGLAVDPGSEGRVCITHAGSGTASLYAGDAQNVPLHPVEPRVIMIPSSRVYAPHPDKLAEPTGVVWTSHSATDFVVSGEGVTGPSALVVVTLDGHVCGWAPGQTRAVPAYDHSVEGSMFTGVTVTDRPSGNRLYICDSGLASFVVLDHEFNPVEVEGDFRHPDAPAHEFAPNNMVHHQGEIYTVFARVAARGGDAPSRDHGYNGFLGVFDAEGRFLRSFEHRMEMHAPWGMAFAPDTFGALSGALLVSNFGDGAILAYDPASGRFIDFLRAEDGAPVVIDGVWGLAYGDGVRVGRANHLYFVAGPNLEEDGVFGKLIPLQP